MKKYTHLPQYTKPLIPLARELRREMTDIAKDKKRDDYLKEHGLEVLRFSDIEVLQNTSGVIQTIYDKIKEKVR